MKQKKMKKKATALLLAVAMIVTSFPQYVKEVYAAAELPDSTKFVTIDELKDFNTNDNDGEKKSAKVYFGNNNQQWWIAGSQQKHGLTMFSASSIVTDMPFSPNFSEDKTYDSSWNCTYPNGAPKEVSPNHYGASYIRAKLQGLETSYFTDAEQSMMNQTTIYTDDDKNNRVYSTTDKLYLAYGKHGDRYITVGKNGMENNHESLNTALRVDNSYWFYNENFWLRAPYILPFETPEPQGRRALVAVKKRALTNHYVDKNKLIIPAFEMNISNVSFASVASAASYDGQLSVNDAFTLRYSTNNLGSALVSYDKNKVTLTDVPNGTYLVVQNSDGAWAKKITKDKEVFAKDMSLENFANCKVWLETTDKTNRMTYAIMADEEKGTAVNIVSSEGINITSNNGVQEVAQNTAIADIIVEVTDGYYLPNDYISKLQGKLNGLSVAKTDNGFKISGTPTSNVNITLPAATVLPKADTPQVTISKTATNITATVTNHKKEFGDIEYKWDNGNFKTDNNTLLNLKANTTHKLIVRFTGNGFYQPSEQYSIEITTLKDGNSVIVVPEKLITTYKEGLKLSNLALAQDWSWKSGEISLSAGKTLYPATFDTTSLEDTVDFSGVEGYDKTTHKVTRNVEVEVRKADSTVTITTQSLDKKYDGNVVNIPKYTTSGSNGKVTIKWQENTSTKDTPKWEDLKSAPSTVGTYRVVVELAGNDNYNPASATLNFVISQATNTWVEELSITGWTYNDKVNDPVAKAQFGDVRFTYSSKENGTYSNEVPKNAGIYYVKATVAQTENYSGLESAPVAFEIAKAIPAYEKVTGLVLGQGQPLSKIKLPEQFKWVDETTIADELGTHIFRAIYTPKDTANYQIIEVDVEVKVVPTPVEINNVPIINASDKTINIGDEFEPLKDVTATDKEDGDLTSKIKVISNTVDTKKAGTYEVTYQVTDSQGAATTKTIKVTVEAKSTPVNPDKDKPNNDKDNNSVETGDRNSLLPWGLMLIVSSIALLYNLYRKKRKTN